MKTFIFDLIPKLQRFSKKLDDVTLLSNQHWVVIDEIGQSKNVYIFRNNNDLLISHNGKVEKARWEYLGNNSLLIDKRDGAYLFRHGFLDENILALKVDSKDEYAFLVNENRYDGELNSIDKISDFLTKKYITPNPTFISIGSGYNISNHESDLKEPEMVLVCYDTHKGTLEIEQTQNIYPDIVVGRYVFQDSKPAPDGKYRLGIMWYVYVENGKVSKTSIY